MPIDPFSASLIIGGLSSAGSWLTNRANSNQAKRQMDFQRDMSSTAAQRGVADYRAAGLNPALAYERPAGGAGGAAATINDSLTQGVNSAFSARERLQSMAIAKAQAEQGLKLAQAQTAQAGTQSLVNAANAVNAEREGIQQVKRYGWEEAVQPFQLRLAGAKALTEELTGEAARLGMSGLRNEDALNRMMGVWRPGLGVAGSAANSIGQLIPSGRSLGAFFQGLRKPVAPTINSTRIVLPRSK